MDPSDAIAAVALAFSALSSWVAWGARRDARKAVGDGLWSTAIEAVLRLAPLDENDPGLGAKVQNERLAFVALADGIKGKDWDHLDEWLQAEHTLGMALLREVFEAHEVNPSMSVEQALTIRNPHNRWVSALANNLRLFRKEPNRAEIVKLRDNTTQVWKSVFAKHGWDEPVDLLEGLRDED